MAFNQYITNTLLITNAQRLAINVQGLTQFDDFHSLTETDIHDICVNVRRPGGTIPNPVFNPDNVIPGIAQFISNPGVPLGQLAEKRLKMLRYYVVHLRRCQRPFQMAHADIAHLLEVYRLKEVEDDAEDPTLPAKLTTIDTIRQTIENIDSYLLLKRGCRGVLLAYITRDTVDLPADDPGFGLPSYNQELISRCPHTGTEYHIDNTLVWNVIRHIMHESPGWTWVQSFQRTQNGRDAYLAMKAHYLGRSFTSRIKANADHILSTSYYDGKSRAFTFERYCEILKGAFSDLETTDEPVPEARKVRIMLQGLTDSRLASVKVNILANESTIGSDFETAVNFVAQFLDDRKALNAGNRGPQQQQQQQRIISQVQSAPGRTGGGRFTGRGGRGGRGGRVGGRANGRGFHAAARGQFSGTITDQYYSPDVWRTLTPEQQDRARQLRTDRDNRRGIQVVDTRRVRQRNDNGTDHTTVTPSTISTISTPVTAGIGATMSQRVLRTNI